MFSAASVGLWYGGLSNINFFRLLPGSVVDRVYLQMWSKWRWSQLVWRCSRQTWWGIDVVVIANQFLFLLSRILKVEDVTLDDAGDNMRRVSLAAVVLDGLSSSTDVDMPCQGLLSMFFWRQTHQPAVGSTKKRRLHQNILNVEIAFLWKIKKMFIIIHYNCVSLVYWPHNKCICIHIQKNSFVVLHVSELISSFFSCSVSWWWIYQGFTIFSLSCTYIYAYMRYWSTVLCIMSIVNYDWLTYNCEIEHYTYQLSCKVMGFDAFCLELCLKQSVWLTSRAVGLCVVKECEFAGETWYIGQQLRGELGGLEHASWIKPTMAHSARSAHRHRRREIIVTVENVRTHKQTFSKRFEKLEMYL